MESSFQGSRSSRDRSILRDRLRKLDREITQLEWQLEINKFLRWGRTKQIEESLLKLDEKRRITRLRLKGYDV